MAPTSLCRSQHNPYTASTSSPKNYSTPTRSLFRTAAALFLSTSFTLRAFAQNPISTQCSAYTTVDEKTLYVQGGVAVTGPSNQFYSLDLTVLNFNASSPPWKALSLGSGANSSPSTNCPSMTLSADKQSLLVWNAINIAKYTMASDTWQPALNLPPTASSNDERVVTVADPSSGTVYALAGASNGSKMLSWTESSGFTKTLAMPDLSIKSNVSIARYAATWSTDRGSALLVGGYKELTPSPFLFEFNPAKVAWEQAKQTGPSPPVGLVDHCMVPAYNGTRMVVFGGVNKVDFTKSVGGIYFLDLKTLKWTRGVSAAPRSLMACAAAGDNFIVWGGIDQADKPPSQPMIIYNMKTNAWTNQFTLPPPPPPPPSPTPSPSQGSSTGGTGSTSPSSSSSSLPSKSNKDTTDTSNNVYLIGGFAAAVVVLAIIAILGYRRYRTKKPKELTKEEFYADFENKQHHADERGQPMDEDYLRERMAHHPQRSPRISPPILDTYNDRSRSRSPDEYDHDHDHEERRVPSEEYYRRAPSPDQYNRRSSSPVYEMPPPPVLMSRSTPTPPPSRRAAVAAAAAAAYSDDGRHGSKASYQGSDGGRRGGRGGRGSNSGSGSGSAVGSAIGGGGGGGYVSDSDDPSTPRHDMTTRSYSPSRYRQPRYPHPNTPSPRPTHSQSSPSQQQQQFEPHGLTTLSPVHHQGNRIRPQNNHGRDQQVHPDDLRAMDDATLYSHVKVVMQAVDERNRR